MNACFDRANTARKRFFLTRGLSRFQLFVGLMGSMLFITLLSQEASARPDTRQLSCQQVQKVITDNGQITLTTGQGTYKRFVATGQYCIHGERATSDWVDAADGACRVRFVCQNIRPGNRQ